MEAAVGIIAVTVGLPFVIFLGSLFVPAETKTVEIKNIKPDTVIQQQISSSKIK